MTVQRALHALYVKIGKAQFTQHEKEVRFFAVPCGPVGIVRRGRVVTCELLYERFHQGLPVGIAIAAEGEEKGLREIIENHYLTIVLILCLFNEGQSTLYSEWVCYEKLTKVFRYKRGCVAIAVFGLTRGRHFLESSVR